MTASAHAVKPAAVPGGRTGQREQRLLLAGAVPGALLIAGLLGLPMLWLISVSFLDGAGQLSLVNYSRLFSDLSYAKGATLTFWLALVTTALCALAGYVVAYSALLLPRRAALLVLAMVTLPFWTSVLVRTYAWLVLLQNRGIVNNLLLRLEVIDEPLRMMHNTTGALIGMIHIMLPFMVLPLYANLRKIDPEQMKAAAGLGASAFYRFWTVFFPQSLPGLVAGCSLVFILSLGFYVTPALLGGGKMIVIPLLIEQQVNLGMDWGGASAATMVFVALVLAIFGLVTRLVPLERMFSGGRS